MENTNTKTTAKIDCKYKDSATFVMTCEKKEDPESIPAPVQAQQPEVETPVTVETAPETENIEVPIVGEINDSDESYVEPLGETSSWYPDTVNYENVVNYQYGTSSEYVASLTNPEVGFEASDILLVAIIALSCLAVLGSITYLTGRAINNKATRKDFIKKV